MTRSMVLFALVAAVALLCFADPASAYYNPTVGRWVTRDPVGDVDGPNQYQYAGGAPPGNRDPDGLYYMEYRKGKTDKTAYYNSSWYNSPLVIIRLLAIQCG